MRMGLVGEKKKYGVFPFFFALLPRARPFCLCFSIGSLGNNDGDGYVNVTWILKSHCFNLYRTYSTSDSSNVGNFSQIWILQNIFQSSGKEKESHCLVSTSFTKREIRHFHVVVVQWLQRNVQKSMMHVQSCCFANLNLLLFCRSRWRRRRRWLWTGPPYSGFTIAAAISVPLAHNLFRKKKESLLCRLQLILEAA